MTDPTRSLPVFHGQVPTEKQLLEIMAEQGLPRNIIEHSKLVRELSLQITKKLRREGKVTGIDEEVVIAAAIAHDIGRLETHGLEHGIAGGMILRQMKIDERVCRAAEVHVLGGFTREEIEEYFAVQWREKIDVELIPGTMEEKIVCLADKHAIGTRKASLEKRFSRWFKKHGRTPFLIRAMYRVLKIEEEIVACLNEE